ncbi:hypothetical protein IWX49DRAFT_591231 [Phyllosticta citricarpa]|uniref:Uncharacterized protein n=2 Tax=Phyllosticta TaxID=121621 RepID=A0ABR1MGN9_9PEZI
MSTASSTTLATSKTTTAAASSSSASENANAAIALTTTFTPPSPCASHRLTMLSDYRIWLNEPLPVPGSTFSSCYPSAWIASYSSVEGSTSSIAPLVTPMLCPSGWDTASSVSQGSLSGYFACCPTGFHLTLPPTTAVSTRPFYGGTCYSDFTLGDTVTVAKYDSSSFSASIPFTPKATDQAFGHPIDGFALGAIIPTATGSTTATAATNTSGGGASASSGSAAAQSSAASSGGGSSGLSGGAIAGIVIGVVAGVALLALAAWALLRRRRKASTSAAAAAAGIDATEKDASSPSGADSNAGINNEIHGNEVAEMGGEARQVHEMGAADTKGVEGGFYGGPPRAEMEGRGVHDVAELDGESPGGGRR